jgi:hypothetical protein
MTKYVVKVQMPLASNDPDVHWMVYAGPEREHLRLYKRASIPEWVREKVIAAGGKAYFDAILNDVWMFVKHREPQPW